ncbi:putative ribonuclease H-like domain-containing protein, partial [Tanacetum coccineum]
ILTKSDIVPISTARQISSREATLVSTARPINTAVSKPFVNVQKPKPNAFQKSHSLSKRPFCQQTALKNRILNNKVNTAKVNSVNTANGKRVTSAVGKQGINAVKSSACWVWRPKVNVVDHVSKNSDPYVALKDIEIFDSGFSRHMTGNKSYLTDYQDHDGGFVAFAGSSKGGKITGKVNAGNKTNGNAVNTVSSSFSIEDLGNAREQRDELKSLFGQDKDDNNTYMVFTPVNTATHLNDDPLMPNLEDTADLQDTGIFGNAYDDKDVGTEANINNLETTMIQTRRMHKQNEAGLITFINKQRRTNHKDFQNCLFACFLSQMEPKKVTQALDDESWVEAMQEELLHFKLLNVWTLVDLPHGKKAIARLVAQGHRQEEGIDYDEVFAPVARIEAIRLFLAYASFMDFTVYQMDVKSVFLYGTIEEEVYVSQPPSFVDPEFPNKVYKVEKALYGLHQAPRAWYETLSIYLLENGFRRGTIDKTLFIKKIKNDILLVQVYVDDIIFGYTKKSLSTEFEQLMHKRFQMSSMGELTFFLGLQQALQRKTHKHRRTKKDIELPQTSVPQNLRPDEAIHKEEVTVWKGLSLLVLAQMQHITVITYLRPRPRQCLMLKFLREQIQVAVLGAKKPWGVLLLRLGGYTPGSDEGRSNFNELLAIKGSRNWKDIESQASLTQEGGNTSKLSLLMMIWMRRMHPKGRTKDKTQPMFKDKDFDELEDVEVNVDEQITTIRPSQVSTARPEVSTSTPSIPPTTTTVFDDEDVTMAMAQTLMKMRSEKAKETEKGVAIREKEESPKLTRSTTTLQPLPTIDPKDKGKGVLVEEPEKPVKIKRRDQDQFTIEERAKFLVETIEAHKKFRATQRAAKIRSKPPTKSQLRNMMMTYLKNMGDYKHSQLKGKTYEEIHELYERQQKRIQDFIPMDPEKEVIKDSGKKDDSSSKLAGGTRRKTLARKRAGEKQSKESAKRQKLEDTAEEQESAEITEEAETNYEQENEELRMWLTIIPDEEETVDLEILSAKYPIIDWESQSLGSDIHVYKIIRADGFTSYHKIFSSMLRKLDRQDLIDLHRLVMKRFEDTTPEGYNLLLWEI